MSDALDLVYGQIDAAHEDQSAATRRKFVAGAAATLGGLGLFGLPGIANAGHVNPGEGNRRNDPQTILNVAATAEVLATIVNTVGWERGLGGDEVTQRNIKAAARHELIHYRTLKSFGGRAVTKKIWVPDAVFENRTNFLSTLEVGDQIFINAYLIGVREFGKRCNGELAVVAAEFMGVEAVHRALARQSLGKLGNDRAYMKFDQREEAPDAPNKGKYGFNRIEGAVAQLQEAGFGLGKEGAMPGRFYHFDEVKKRTPDDPDVNTRVPNAD
jgi:hypothetical protein